MFNAPRIRVRTLPLIQCYPNTTGQLRISSRVILVSCCVYKENSRVQSSLDLDLQRSWSTHISLHDTDGRSQIPSATFAARLVACHWTTATKFNHCSLNPFPHCHNRSPLFSSVSSSSGISDNLLLIWGADIFPLSNHVLLWGPKPPRISVRAFCSIPTNPSHHGRQ